MLFSAISAFVALALSYSLTNVVPSPCEDQLEKFSQGKATTTIRRQSERIGIHPGRGSPDVLEGSHL